MVKTRREKPSKMTLDESLGKINNFAKCMGLPLEKKQGTKKSYFIYFFNTAYINLHVMGAICWFVEGTIRGESLTSLTYVAPCISLTFLANIKSVCFLIYRKHVYNLVDTLRGMEIDANRRSRAEEKDEIIQTEINFLHLVLKMLNIFNWFLIISFPLMPMVLIILDYMKTKEVHLVLPLLIVYPFDAFDIRVFPFVYVNQIIAVIIVVLQIYCIDAFFYVSSTHVRIQFQILAHELERLVDPSDAAEFGQEFQHRLQDLVVCHQKLMFSVEELEVIYCKSTLYNFVISSALICLTGFNVSANEDVAFVISFLSFLFMSLLQIFFLCFYGDMLMKASEDISEAVYNCKWYMADVRAAKMLLIIQVRAQKACKLTALGFADVNLRAFTKILSTAWSYFALLQTVYRDLH